MKIEASRIKDLYDRFNGDFSVASVFVFLFIKTCCSNDDSIGEDQCKVTIQEISEATKYTLNQVRLILKKLEESQTIHKQTTNKSSIITICNIDSYNTQKSTQAQTKHKQTTNRKEEQETEKERLSPCTPSSKEKDKEKEESSKASKLRFSDKGNDSGSLSLFSEEETKARYDYPTPPAELDVSAIPRFNRFYDSLIPYVEKFGRDTVREFFNWWTEPSVKSNGRKMKFETMDTWSTGGRLATWHRKKAQSQPHQPIQPNNQIQW